MRSELPPTTTVAGIKLRLAFSLLCLAQIFTCSADDLKWEHSLSSKRDEELLLVLQETDAGRRLAAVNYLSMRYRPAGSLLVNSKYHPPEALRIDSGIPESVVRGLFHAATDDEEIVVRLAAVNGMRGFFARTNILRLFESLLDSTNSSVRLHVVEKLIDLGEQQRKPVLPHLLETLRRSLTAQESEDVLLRALKCASRLGRDAQSLAEPITDLSRHGSRSIRSEAQKALKKIR